MGVDYEPVCKKNGPYYHLYPNPGYTPAFFPGTKNVPFRLLSHPAPYALPGIFPVCPYRESVSHPASRFFQVTLTQQDSMQREMGLAE